VSAETNERCAAFLVQVEAEGERGWAIAARIQTLADRTLSRPRPRPAGAVMFFTSGDCEDASAEDLVRALHRQGAASRVAAARRVDPASQVLRSSGRHRRRPRRQRRARKRLAGSSRDGPEPPGRRGGSARAGRAAFSEGLGDADVAHASSRCEVALAVPLPWTERALDRAACGLGLGLDPEELGDLLAVIPVRGSA